MRQPHFLRGQRLPCGIRQAANDHALKECFIAYKQRAVFSRLCTACRFFEPCCARSFLLNGPQAPASLPECITERFCRQSDEKN